jgi:hypothetical protein
LIPSHFGLLITLIGLILMFRATSVGLLNFMMICSLFGGSAAITLTAIGGSSVSPAHMALLFLIARIIAPGSKDIGKIPSGLRANVFFGFYAIYGAITAFILPFVFQGQVDLVPMRPITMRSLYDVFPLSFSPQNITTGVYMLGSFMAAVSATVVARHPESAIRVPVTAAIMGWTHVILGVVGVILTNLGLNFVFDFFRNGSYAQLEQSYGGLVRIAGVFPEASAYAAFGFAWFVFNFECWVRDVQPKWTGSAAVALFLILILSTSGSAYVSLAGYSVLFALRTLLFPASLPVGKGTWIGGVAIAGAALVGLMIIAVPGLAAQLGDMIHHMTFDKAESTSGQQRSFWAMQGWHAFLASYGLGVGPGSFRSSSIITAILGSTGVFGIVTYLLHVLRVAQPLRRSTHSQIADKRLAAGVAAGWTVVGIIIPASIGSASPDPGLNFAILSGLALGWRLAPSRKPAPGPVGWDAGGRIVGFRGRTADPRWSAS